MKSLFLYIFKGIFIGTGMLIPGVSGGTVAIFLDVFEDILESVGGFFKHTIASLKIILPIAIGALGGIICFSKPIEIFCGNFPILSKIIFCTIALISCFFFVKKKIGFNPNAKQIICIVSGGLIAIIISVIIALFKINFSHAGFMLLFLIGVFLALALILPAISFSYMLLFFGIYEIVLSAITNIKLDILIPLGFGVILGSYIFSKMLLKLLDQHTKETYCFVFGFVLMSIADILI